MQSGPRAPPQGRADERRRKKRLRELKKQAQRRNRRWATTRRPPGGGRALGAGGAGAGRVDPRPGSLEAPRRRFRQV